jgi:hypothetical protein
LPTTTSFQESDQHAQQSLVGTQDLAYFTSEVIQRINEEGFDLKILGRVVTSASGELVNVYQDISELNVSSLKCYGTVSIKLWS